MDTQANNICLSMCTCKDMIFVEIYCHGDEDIWCSGHRRNI